MKKIFLFLCIFISISIATTAQKSESFLSVNDTAENFIRTIPVGAVVFVKDSAQFYLINTTKYIAGQSMHNVITDGNYIVTKPDPFIVAFLNKGIPFTKDQTLQENLLVEKMITLGKNGGTSGQINYIASDGLLGNVRISAISGALLFEAFASYTFGDDMLLQSVQAGGNVTFEVHNTSSTANSHARLFVKSVNGDAKTIYDTGFGKGWNIGKDKTDNLYKWSYNNTGDLETDTRMSLDSIGGLTIESEEFSIITQIAGSSSDAVHYFKRAGSPNTWAIGFDIINLTTGNDTSLSIAYSPNGLPNLSSDSYFQITKDRDLVIFGSLIADKINSEFFVSQTNLSYGESYINGFKDLAITDGGSYFSNGGGYQLGKLKQIGILRDASLILTPSATKTSILYSTKPFTDGQFVVARNSAVSSINADGYLQESAVNIARIDYTDEDAAVLLEPQRTNLITHPISFDNAFWSKNSSTVVSGQVSPSIDYATSAFKLVGDVGSNSPSVSKSSLLSASSIYAMSVYAKADEATIVYLNAGGNATNDYCWFDLSTETITEGVGTNAISTSIESLANGWYRCTLVRTAEVTSVHVGMSDVAESTAYVGDGSSGLFIYGAQAELGSYCTSLTYAGVEGSTVTRLADVINGAGTATLFNDSEGVLYAEIAALSDDGTSRRISLSDGSTSNRVTIIYDAVSNTIKSFISSGGGVVGDLEYVVSDVTSFSKVAVKYKLNDFALWIDGVERAVDVGGAAPLGLDQLRFEGGNGSNDFYGKCKGVQVYNRALTNTELSKLTGN